MRKVERQLLTLVSLGVHAQAVLRREREHAGIVLLAAKGPEGALAGVDKVPAALNLAPVPRRASVPRHDCPNLFTMERDDAPRKQLYEHNSASLVVLVQLPLENLPAQFEGASQPHAPHALRRSRVAATFKRCARDAPFASRRTAAERLRSSRTLSEPPSSIGAC
jgi:hypothetical protein